MLGGSHDVDVLGRTSEIRLSCKTALSLACLVLFMIALQPTLLRADDNAHGQSTPTTDNNPGMIHQPGPAVRAARTSQRYTPPGMTLNPVAIDIDPQGNIYD